ncbi:hypothetical protein F4782DRAFT_493702 [Xylaria castorea]|nr:hypothetical protein F4782DRAFT_493702 [Xylaria castorea]
MANIDSKDSLKICDPFDMIGGTSAGGLIASMLGRMCSTADGCIVTYGELSLKAFT